MLPSTCMGLILKVWGSNAMTLPWFCWPVFQPQCAWSSGLFPFSTLSLSLMSSCLWGCGPHHCGWFRLECWRSSKAWALPGLPWHAISSCSVPGAVGSSALSTLTQTTPWHCGRSPHLHRRPRLKCQETAMLAPCCDSLAMLFLAPASNKHRFFSSLNPN